MTETPCACNGLNECLFHWWQKNKGTTPLTTKGGFSSEHHEGPESDRRGGDLVGHGDGADAGLPRDRPKKRNRPSKTVRAKRRG